MVIPLEPPPATTPAEQMYMNAVNQLAIFWFELVKVVRSWVARLCSTPHTCDTCKGHSCECANARNQPPTSMARMNVAVFGGTQGCGKEFLIQALSAGHEVTVLARNPAKLDDLSVKPRVIKGNVHDASLVRQVIAGQDVVVVCLGMSRMETDDMYVCSKGTKSILAAMQSEGVQRVLVVTMTENVEPRVFERNLLGIVSTALSDKHKQSAAVQDSGLDWTLVEVPWLTDGPLTGAYNVGKDIWVTTVSRKDVGHFILQNLASTEFVKSAVTVSDP
ncbi:hypothetical protein BJ741DRAFT_586989 [Chytriomyces cf. hyalinus JEL632]|nr:hypothetical protein BJ741DRAFT_586989 [Chytriomyces cf. hyalinus JEL632]